MAPILVGYSLGIALGFFDPTFLELPWFLKISMGILLLLLLFYSRKERHGFWVFCLLVSIFLGLLRMGLTPEIHKPNLQNSPEKQTLAIQLKNKLKSSETQLKFEALAFPNREGKLLKPEKIILSKAIDSSGSDWQTGQLFWTRGYLNSVGLPRMPGQFNYRDYLETQGIHFQWYVTRAIPIKPRLVKNSSWAEKIRSFRTQLLYKIERSGFNSQALQVYAALVFGDRTNIEKERLTAYQNAGAVHILAISGLHIGIITALLWGLLRPLRLFRGGRVISGLILMGCLWTYAAFSGFSPSVIRAVSMWSFLSLSLLIKRPQYSLHLLGVAYLANLIWDPLALFSLGFSMSYTAVFFILLGMPFFNESWTPKSKIIKIAWQLLGVSVCAQLGVLAWSLYAFNQFPILFLVTNLMVIPFLGFILGSGLGLALWYVVGSPPRIFINAYGWVLESLNSFIDWVGTQEAWVLTDIYFPKIFIGGTLALCLGVLAYSYPYNRSKKTWKYALLGGFIFWSVWLYKFQENRQKQELLIMTDGRQTVLVSLADHRIIYWSKEVLSPLALSNLRRHYPYKKISKSPLTKAFSFKEQQLVWSPQGPNILKNIDYMLIDLETKAYPEDFTATQLAGTQFILSSYAQSKQMYLWEKWLQKNARPAWRLDAQGYYNFNAR